MPLNMGNFSVLWCTGRNTNIETLIKTTAFAQKCLLTWGISLPRYTGRKTNIESLIKTTAYAQKCLLTHGEFLYVVVHTGRKTNIETLIKTTAYA
jgi:hypothetical protein